MWIADGTEEYLLAIRGPHEPIYRVDVYLAAALATPARYIEYGLPLSSGTIDDDATNSVRRTCQLTIADPDLAPIDAYDLLAPYGAELRIQAGVQYPDGRRFLFPVGTFGIQSADITDSGANGMSGVNVVGADRAQRLVDSRLEGPYTIRSGATVTARIGGLVAAGLLPLNPTLVDLAGDDTACVRQVIRDNDRMAAVTALADSIGVDFMFGFDGRPTVKAKPNAKTDAYVWVADVGPNGVIAEATLAVDRADIFNALIVSTEPDDGSDPITARVVDNNAESSTFYGGTFGTKPAFLTSSSARTQAKLISIGNKHLGPYIGAGWSTTLAVAPNLALESGDVIQARYSDGRRQRHIVDKITGIPLTVGDGEVMTIECRTNDPGGDQEL